MRFLAATAAALLLVAGQAAASQHNDFLQQLGVDNPRYSDLNVSQEDVSRAALEALPELNWMVNSIEFEEGFFEVALEDRDSDSRAEVTVNATTGETSVTEQQIDETAKRARNLSEARSNIAELRGEVSRMQSEIDRLEAQLRMERQGAAIPANGTTGEATPGAGNGSEADDNGSAADSGEGGDFLSTILGLFT